MFRVGEWLQCASCGEESLYLVRDPLDWSCSVCGCSAPMIDAENGADVAFWQLSYHSS